LVDFSVKNRQPFAEVLPRKADFLDDFPGPQRDFAQRGLARDSGAFVKIPA
jgi:hypothetical protein